MPTKTTTLQDPVFGPLKWDHPGGAWEADAATFPGVDGTFLLAVDAEKPKAPPSDEQRRAYREFVDAWESRVRPQVVKKIWGYWRGGVDKGGMFGSIPVDSKKAAGIKTPEALFATLSLLTFSVRPARGGKVHMIVRWDWDWDLMGVVAHFDGTKVMKVTSFGDDYELE